MTKKNKKELCLEIKKIIEECSLPYIDVEHTFHHNASYKDGVSILKNGILSFEQKKKLEGSIVTREERFRYLDDAHVNGLDSISVASLNIDTSLMYEGELLYDPFDINLLDFLIGNVKAGKNTFNYYNEYLVKDKVDIKDIKSLDIRLLSQDVDLIIQNYEYLRKMAILLYENNIPLREETKKMVLDTRKLAKMPTLH